jgi:L-ascorbate metabolism protein UlaG (beta-lactamase superfamily)
MALVLYFLWLSSPDHRGPRTDHFDGHRFHNHVPVRHHIRPEGIWTMLKILRSDWVDEEFPSPGGVPLARLPEGELAVTPVGHSTVLLQIGGLNVLTDPVYDEYCGPLPMNFLRRRRRPGLALEELPPIDLVVVSHNHYDHLSPPTLKWLHHHHRPRFLCALGDQALLEAHGIDRVQELDWWDQVELEGGEVATFVPAQHMSGRGLLDKDTSLWGGFVIEGRAGGVYFAGDTAYCDVFQKIRERFGPMRLALLPIGAFQPWWYMHEVHMDPHHAVRAHRVLEATRSLAIHYGVFPLGTDLQHEPVEELAVALAEEGVDPEEFWVLAPGECREVP